MDFSHFPSSLDLSHFLELHHFSEKSTLRQMEALHMARATRHPSPQAIRAHRHELGPLRLRGKPRAALGATPWASCSSMHTNMGVCVFFLPDAPLRVGKLTLSVIPYKRSATTKKTKRTCSPTMFPGSANFTNKLTTLFLGRKNLGDWSGNHSVCAYAVLS